MTTKKLKITSIALALIMTVSLFGTFALTGSAQSAHTHSIEDSFWCFDEKSHWHKCIDEDCTVSNYSGISEAEYAAHTDTNTDGICDVCAYHFAHDHTGWTELTLELLESSVVSDDTPQKNDVYQLSEGKYYLNVRLATSHTIQIAANTVICLNGNTIDAQYTASGYQHNAISILDTGSLTLYDCSGTNAGVITGGSAHHGPAIYAQGPLRIFGGTIKENNSFLTTDADYNGTTGAVNIVGSEFHMYGGVITQNISDWGGGVYTQDTCVFNMYGGSISYNQTKGMAAKAGAGVYVGGETVMNMYGGSIDHNIGRNRSSGIYVGRSACLNMYGGEICYNTIADDRNDKTQGGAVTYEGAFNMYGGSIHHNQSIYGGAVGTYYSNATFNMYGGEIYNNKSEYGGAICVGEASTYGSYTSSFNMYGGKIYKNEAKNGGGIYVGLSGLAKLYGGEISENNATNGIGGGVFVDSDSKGIQLSGNPIIADNTSGENSANLVLLDTTVNIIGALTSAKPIGITFSGGEGIFSSGWITHMATASVTEFFFDDTGLMDVILNSDETELEMSSAHHKDENKDHKCDNGCAKFFGAHEDGATVDHKCEYCGEEITHDCIDENKDHSCDKCDTPIGEHKDTDGDHACDYGCDEAIGEHADKDGDGKCNVCKGEIPKEPASENDGNSDNGEASDSPADAQTSDQSTENGNKKGCKSTVTGASVCAIAIAIIGGSSLLRKKKED